MGGHLRRNTHSAEFKSRLIAACHQPGISVSGLALAHGVNANLLRRWMKQAQDGSRPRALVPVRVSIAHRFRVFKGSELRSGYAGTHPPPRGKQSRFPAGRPV
ncbi:MAG: transposase [Acidiferrobacteraceae bacterium]